MSNRQRDMPSIVFADNNPLESEQRIPSGNLDVNFAILRNASPVSALSRLFRGGSRGWLTLRHFADSRIPREDQVARSECRIFKIRCAYRKDLPARNAWPEHSYRAHSRKLVPQAPMVLRRGREPYAVVGGRIGPVAENEDDFVLDVDRNTAEHRPRDGRDGTKGIQYEVVRHRLASPGREDHIVAWIGNVAMTVVRHSEVTPERRHRRTRSEAGSSG